MSFTEARQILKLPNLVEHYISHKITGKNTTFFSFIEMHYFEDHGIDSDYSQDMKLPFKTHESNVFSIGSLAVPEIFSIKLKAPENFGQKAPIFSYFSGHTSDAFASIFRPPIFI
ncbi:hypothetical protein SAMN05421638_0332 [Kaistella treverensis]|uniref:Uncharacterized protein n=1 Tax=Kaistella treverensis TaxID=631455 RepID=A0A1I3JRT7_9FLAO|nr:hypothetical protein [Kaistella treverensis]SFI62645.1 hypothetical protein SAMN05421638_0332 [Kaistella treverensis]